MAKDRTGTCKIYTSCKISLYPDSSMPAAPTMPCGAGSSIRYPAIKFLKKAQKVLKICIFLISEIHFFDQFFVVFFRIFVGRVSKIY